MGNHSMKQKKPGTVLSVGPVFLDNKYQKAKVDGKRVRVLVKQYEGNTGANRATRRMALSKFRHAYGRAMFASVRESIKKGMPLDAKVKIALDEFLAGEVYRAAKRQGARV